MYRYFAAFRRHLDDDRLLALSAALQGVGLEAKLTQRQLVLYASPDTPVTQLNKDAVLIGHVFPREGGVPIDRIQASGAPTGRGLIDFVVNAYWGEYLILHAPDNQGEPISAVRDPSGGVDCVYSQANHFITSDISLAVHADLFVKRIDWDLIRERLAYPHLKTGRTGFIGLSELLPGYRLRIDGNRSSVDSVWTPWDFVSRRSRHHDRADAQADVRKAVASAVKHWAETDGALLLELSGGLDSSIVAACLQDTEARVACCNLMTSVPGADERRYARQMSDVLNTELHVATLGLEDAEFDFAPPPQAVTPSTWLLQHASNALCEAIGARLGTRSFFSGGGGDTVFCYTRTTAPAVDAFKERGLIAGIEAVRDLAELHQCTFWKAGGLALRKLVGPVCAPRVANETFLAKATCREVPVSHPWFVAPAGAQVGDRERIIDLAGTQVFRDGLARGTHGRFRMPLLSQPVVEACLRVPSWMWISGGRNRAVARDAFADILPADILHRRSKGTFVSYAGAIFRRNKGELRDYILAGELHGSGLLDGDALRRFFDRDAAIGDESFMRIFDLCAAENWIRHQI